MVWCDTSGGEDGGLTSEGGLFYIFCQENLSKLCSCELKQNKKNIINSALNFSHKCLRIVKYSVSAVVIQQTRVQACYGNRNKKSTI